MPAAAGSSAQPMGELAELQRKCASLEEQLVRVRQERIEYLQNVSHQLVAPLNAIKWHIENITEARVGVDRARKVLRSIYSQATLAVHLAKNFSLMSNLEADHALSKLKEPLQEVNLRRLLVNLADDFQPLAWDKEVNIRVDKRRFDNEPAVLAMRPLVSQAFANIIENAVKYSADKTTIIVLGEHVPAADVFNVTVLNHGIRLRESDRERVFSRSYRSKEAQSKYPAGTGFGLYIAQRIIALHGGSIKAGTRDDMTWFKVTLSVTGLKGKARIRERKDSAPR